jgi:hypothetical protein
VAAQPKIYGRPATFPLFSLLFLLLYFSLSQQPHLRDKLESFLPHGLAAPATYLGQPARPWLPYKGAAKGSLVLHPISSQAQQNFQNPSPNFEFPNFSVRVLMFRVESRKFSC